MGEGERGREGGREGGRKGGREGGNEIVDQGGTWLQNPLKHCHVQVHDCIITQVNIKNFDS